MLETFFPVVCTNAVNNVYIYKEVGYLFEILHACIKTFKKKLAADDFAEYIFFLVN